MGQLCCRPQKCYEISPFSSLPDEIIIDILSRLPEMSVKACKSVCLTWNRLSATPQFIKRHLHKSRPVILAEILARNGHREVIVVFEGSDWCKAVPRKDMKTLWSDHGTDIYASCNGIVLLTGTTRYAYAICNPVTREWVNFRLETGKVCGFFFHRLEEEYKLLLYHDQNGVITYSFFGLTTKEMRHLIAPRNYPPSDNAPAVVAYGALFWSVKSSNTYNGTIVDSDAIIKLDVETETFQELPQPTSRYRRASLKLLEVDGKLSCCNLYGNIVEVWNLEDLESWRWVKRSVVNFGNVKHSYGATVVAILHETLLLRCNSCLFLCNLRQNYTLTKVKNIDTDLDSMTNLYATKYTSSFVSLQESNIF